MELIPPGSPIIFTKKNKWDCYRFDTTNDALLALKCKKIDAYFTDEYIADKYAKLVEGLKIVRTGMQVDDLCAFCPAKNVEIVRQWNEFIPKMKKMELWQKISRAFTVDFTEPKEFAINEPPASGPLIKVGYEPASYPLAYIDADSDRPYGYFIELVILFAREYGYQVEFISGSWDSNLFSILEGKLDFAVEYYSDIYRDDILGTGNYLMTQPIISYNVIYLVRNEE